MCLSNQIVSCFNRVKSLLTKYFRVRTYKANIIENHLSSLVWLFNIEKKLIGTFFLHILEYIPKPTSMYFFPKKCGKFIQALLLVIKHETLISKQWLSSNYIFFLSLTKKLRKMWTGFDFNWFHIYIQPIHKYVKNTSLFLKLVLRTTQCPMTIHQSLISS